jgi:hypothetical protein
VLWLVCSEINDQKTSFVPERDRFGLPRFLQSYSFY